MAGMFTRKPWQNTYTSKRVHLSWRNPFLFYLGFTCPLLCSLPCSSFHSYEVLFSLLLWLFHALYPTLLLHPRFLVSMPYFCLSLSTVFQFSCYPFHLSPHSSSSLLCNVDSFLQFLFFSFPFLFLPYLWLPCSLPSFPIHKHCITASLSLPDSRQTRSSYLFSFVSLTGVTTVVYCHRLESLWKWLHTYDKIYYTM